MFFESGSAGVGVPGGAGGGGCTQGGMAWYHPAWVPSPMPHLIPYPSPKAPAGACPRVYLRTRSIHR